MREGRPALAMERAERRLPAILAAACEDMAKQQIKNISRPVRVYRLTMDRGAPIGMQTAPLLLPDKPSVVRVIDAVGRVARARVQRAQARAQHGATASPEFLTGDLTGASRTGGRAPSGLPA